MKLQLASQELTTLANESKEAQSCWNVNREQKEKGRKWQRKSAFNTSAVPSHNLPRRKYPFCNRPMKFEFVSLHDEENNSAVSSASEDPDNSQHILNFEEKRKYSKFLSGALRWDKPWKNSNRSSEENHVRGESRYQSEKRRAGQSQQPFFFHSKSNQVRSWALGTNHKTINNH